MSGWMFEGDDVSQAARAGILCVALGVVLCLGVPASADADASPIALGDDACMAYLEQLDADSFVERERATELLGERLQCDDGELFEWIDAQPDLSPEQRARLLRVARSRFDATPRAALGFGFGNFDTSVNGIIVLSVQAGQGFPAVDSGLIRENDRIVAVDGFPLELRSHRAFVSAVIKSYPPGGKMPTIIARPVEDPDRAPGEEPQFSVIETELPLGSWDALGQAPIEQAVLERAWAHRASVLGFGDRDQRVIELSENLTGLVGRRPRGNRDPLIHPAGAYTDLGWFKKRRGSPVSASRSITQINVEPLDKRDEGAGVRSTPVRADERNPDQTLRELRRLLEANERAADDRTQTATQRRLAEDRADRVRERIRSLNNGAQAAP